MLGTGRAGGNAESAGGDGGVGRGGSDETRQGEGYVQKAEEGSRDGKLRIALNGWLR